MKILRFEADHLHGYLSFALSFQSQLTFLTGINGAGKTSALRSIMSLLTPSLSSLVETQFNAISVAVSTVQGERKIAAQRSKDSIALECSGVGQSFTLPIIRRDRFETSARFSARRREFFREIGIRASQNPTISAISSLPTPMYLDLERRQEDWSPNPEEPSVLPRRAPTATRLGTLASDSLEIAEGLAERAFSQYLAWRTERTDLLKQEIILAAFRPAGEIRYDGNIPNPYLQKELLTSIDKKEAVLPISLAEIGVPRDRIEEIVLPFFAHAREAITHAPSSDEFKGKRIDEGVVKRLQNWSAIRPQLRHVDQLASLIDQYNTDLSAKFAPFAAYQESVNRFLSESGKNLKFDTEGGLVVEIDRSSVPRSISALSSGERQLVVILTHLAFNEPAKAADVLIIDEPELSLHLHWQELFVEAVMAAGPELQLILATHSPAIIGRRLDHCIDVLEAQKSDRILGRS